MALTDILGEYKPSGLAGGFAGGLKQGADLGHMFADTASITQQTGAREQLLPGQLSQQNATLDQTRMANDLTRATQTPEILAQKGANTLSAEQFNSLDIKRKMELLPFEKAKQVMDTVDLGQIKFVATISNALKQGTEKQVYQQMKGVLSPEQDTQIVQIIKEIERNPAARAKYAKDMDTLGKSMTDTRNRTDDKTWQERWLQMLRGQQGLAEANARGSGKDSQPNYNVVFVQKLAQRIKELNPTWTKPQVEAEAVRQYKTQNESISFDGKSSGVESNKGIPSTPTSSPMLPKTPTVPGWVKGPDGIMRKQ